MTNDQRRAQEALNDLKQEWAVFCNRALAEKLGGGVAYSGVNRIVKAFGDAFFEQLERFVEEL